MVGERNLTPERGPNVWDREGSADASSRQRWVQGLGGAALAAAGAALVAAGGSRVFRALSGAQAPSQPPGRDEADIVGEESSQSFPASDSPSWTPVEGASTRDRSR
ncbi:MAG TPA: hypothetical protein VK911_05705 [Vicinamibacterales bacterium]|nr:hypothetical protein [Vicinamibacterales bacterium]